MSKDAVKRFYDKVESDKALKAKLAAVAKGKFDEVVKIAAAAGFAFTTDDLVAFGKASAGKVLSEAELDMVAGGTANTGDTGSVIPVPCDRRK